jgi:hypothetical protein
LDEAAQMILQEQLADGNWQLAKWKFRQNDRLEKHNELRKPKGYK